MALEQLSFFWTVYSEVRERITGHNKDTAEAHGAILKAFNHTYNYLRNNQGAYVPNMELADLWAEASTKVMVVNPGLGNMLAVKSRFWGDPDLYFRLNRTENVLELKQITDEMERLMQTMR